MINEKYRNDIEENEEYELTSKELKFWEKKQKELITSTVDYNLGSIADLKVDLSPKYQRRNRWDNNRKSKLIESFLMNVPVPPIFLNEDQYGKYSIIDGKQRITSIKSFFDNTLKLEGLSVFSELNGKFFKDLPSVFQDVIKTRPNLRAITILRMSDKDIKHEVFQRLNTGGMALNPQEIRNNAFPGNLNNLLLELSENELFHKMLGIKNKEKSRIYKEMKDVEFVLRFFAFWDNWNSYSGNMKLTLDNYMEDKKDIPEKEVERLRTGFLNTIEKVYSLFGEFSYKRWQVEKGMWRKQVLAALYDAQMFAVKDHTKSDLAKNSTKILNKYKKLFNENTPFRKAIDSATNNPGPFQDRIEILSNRSSS